MKRVLSTLASVLALATLASAGLFQSCSGGKATLSCSWRSIETNLYLEYGSCVKTTDCCSNLACLEDIYSTGRGTCVLPV